METKLSIISEKPNIQIFHSEQFGDIRTEVSNPDNPLFCLVDICKALDIKNPTQVAARIDADEKAILNIGREYQRSRGNRMAIFVTESGMYDVILRSDSPKAKPIRKWVTSEVLPSIRKQGGYTVSRTDDTNEDIMARAVLIAQEAIKRKDERLRELEIQSELHKEQLQLAAPKVQYYNSVIDSSGLLTINQIASDFGFSAIKLNKILCDAQIQYNQGGCYLLVSKYRECGYAQLKPFPYYDTSGNLRTRQHLYWTEKGRKFIHELLSKKQAV